MQILRRILFYLFLGIYLIICPLIIFSALGYKFNPQDKEIVQTGLLYLSSIPPQADVYFAKSRYGQKTPATVRDLLPGDYFVKLSLKGYKLWQDTLTIKAGKATAFEKILLIPQNWQQRELSGDRFRSLLGLNGTDYLILAKGTKAEDYYIFNCKTEQAFPIFKADSGLKNSRVLVQFSVDGSPQLIIGAELRGKKIFILIKIKEDSAETLDISDLIYEPPLDIVWDPADNRHIFSLHKDKLNRLDVERRTVYPNYVKDLKGYGLNNRQVYILDKDYTLLQSKSDKNDMEPVRVDLILKKLLSAEKGNLRIKILSEENLLFLGNDGELLTNLPPYLLSEEAVEGIEYSKKIESLLFWSKSKIGIIDFLSDDNAIPGKKINLQWLYAKGAKISQCFWVYEDSHIIFRDRDQVYLLELKEDGLQYLENVVRLKENTSFYYHESSGNLYYLEPSSGKFCAIEVVPKKGSALAPFLGAPEQNSNRGEQGL